MSLPKPYYEDTKSGITIYHGDCREILPQLPKVDLVLTDPPYGVNLGNHDGANEKRSGYLVKGKYSTYDDTLDNFKNIVVPTISSLVSSVKRSVVFGCAPNIWLYPPATAIGGVYLPAGCGRTPWGFQNLSIALFYGSAPNLNLGSKATTIRSSDAAEKNGHPCPKPIKWMVWAVDLSSIEGETIIDPFMGSGTTLRAAKDLGRKAIGIEIEEKYCEIAVKRLAQEVLPL